MGKCAFSRSASHKERGGKGLGGRVEQGIFFFILRWHPFNLRSAENKLKLSMGCRRRSKHANSEVTTKDEK
jgi:hypothetical protein